MKIAALISGGVDSSVALALLKQKYTDVTAFYLKIWLEDELSFLGNCPWEDDLKYIQKTCQQLDVPLEVVPLQREYWDRVVSYTIDEIKQGRTPNPDILCNQKVKFDAFFEKIPDSFDKVATGHYAHTTTDANGLTVLHCSPDAVKDQTYFLSGLSQKQLSRALFPLGKLTKPDVRTLATELNLPAASRKDSYGICFLGKIKFNDFLKHHVGENPGELREYETNKVVGAHQGFWYHTIGQRKGLGLSGGPWYVVDKDPDTNIVYISRHYHDTDKQRDHFIIKNPHWIGGNAPEKRTLHVKLRHGPEKHVCTLVDLGDKTYQVNLSENDQGIAPGQFAVFYDGEICLGSAPIAAGSITAPSIS